MEVVINSRFLNQSLTGVQRFALEVSKELSKADKDITFVSPIPEDPGSFESKLPDVHRFGNYSGHLWEQIELPRYLKEHGRPLLINLMNSAPINYKRQIITIHDLSLLRNPEWFSKKYYYYYKLLIPKIAKNCLKIITVSDFSKNEIIELLKVPEGKISVVHDAPFIRFDKSKDDFSTPMRADDEFIVAISSLNPRKNLEGLIDAFLALEDGSLKLLVVGAEHMAYSRSNIIKKIREHDNIILRETVSDKDLASIYRYAKLLVYPSFYEGFGLPVVEAMSYGCPVVASDCSSLPEVCGDAACYVDPYNVASITEGMQKVLGDESLRDDLVKKGYERIKEFNWKSSAKECLNVIREAINT